MNSESWENATALDEADIVDGSLEPLEAGSPMNFTLSKGMFEIDKNYFMAIMAYDEKNQTSRVSNVARFRQVTPPEADGLTGGAIAGIVIGCLLAAFLVVVVGYFIVKRHKAPMSS